MSLLTATVVLTLGAVAPEAVLVAPYQSLGVDPGTVAALTEGFRAAVVSDRLVPMPASASSEATRSAVMCGEDGACLATVGARSAARWVLAFGVGKVGTSLLVSALFIDVGSGRELMRATRRVPEGGADWSAVTRQVADEVVKLPAAPQVIEVPVQGPERVHRFRSWGFTMLGVTLGAALLSSLVGAVAWYAYSQLPLYPAEYDVRARNQWALNISGDLLAVVAAVASVPTLIFFLLDKREAAQ